MQRYANPQALTDTFSLDFDVVVVGSGAAGLYAALNIDPGLSVAMLNKFGLQESNTYYAQGGIASVTLPVDNWTSHKDDTLIAGAGLCDVAAVEALVREGPNDIQELIRLGVPFDRDEQNQVKLCMEGAHSCTRILHCGGDATGYHLARTLTDVAEQRTNITLMNHVTLFDVLTDVNGQVAGVLVQDASRQFMSLRSSSVIIASGGVGRVYRNSTNSACATGDGIAAAIRAGAQVMDMEFVQFHPTALIHPDLNMRYFLISEALRGEGAILRNRRWEPFMRPVHPRADLAPRDIVSRAIVKEMKHFDLPNVYLDITAKPRSFLRERFPVIYEECMKRGIDIAVNWIPVMPVQHYFMGGIQTDIRGRTSISGLYACGESACTGVHGANRLASNSLLECLVFGRHCAETINGLESKRPSVLQIPKAADLSPQASDQPYDFETCRTLIRNAMTQHGGILRNSFGLADAIQLVQDTLDQLQRLPLANLTAVETLNMATVAHRILLAAQARKSSIGAHFREDDLPESKTRDVDPVTALTASDDFFSDDVRMGETGNVEILEEDLIDTHD